MNTLERQKKNSILNLNKFYLYIKIKLYLFKIRMGIYASIMFICCNNCDNKENKENKEKDIEMKDFEQNSVDKIIIQDNTVDIKTNI